MGTRLVTRLLGYGIIDEIAGQILDLAASVRSTRVRSERA